MKLAKLIALNAFRHPARSGLTILGMAVAILAFGMLRTVVDAWYAGVNMSSATRLVTRNAVSLIFSLPIAYREKIRQIEGVKRVAVGNWFGGIYIDEKNFIPNYAVDARPYLEMYPEIVIDDDQRAAFFRDRKGAIAGRIPAEKYGWKLGDTITLKGTIFPGDWDVTIRGFYRGRDKSIDESGLFFHWDYLNERMKQTVPRRADQAGFFMIEVNRPDDAAQVSAAVDAQFRNSLAETLTETERAFNLSFLAMVDAILTVLQVVSFVVIVIIMAVVANTMAMTARERIGEYAILKALGFGGRYVATLVIGEALVLSLTGSAVGIALIYPVADVFHGQLKSFIPVFNVMPHTIWMSVAAGIIVGIVAGVFPAWQAGRVRIADGLRRIG